MRVFALLLAGGLMLPASAWAQDDAETEGEVADEVSDEEDGEDAGEDYPLSAGLSLQFWTTHASFVPTESDDVDFSGTWMVVAPSVSWSIIDSLSLSGGVGIYKALDEGYAANPIPGGDSTQSNNETTLGDVALDLSYSSFYTIPVADISFSGSFGVTIPTSKSSRSAGLITSLGPTLSASWGWEGISASSSFTYYYNVLEDPTVQVDCETAPDFCQVAGSELGSPNELQGWQTTFGLGYTLLDDIRFSVGYLLANGYGAAEFSDDTTATDRFGRPLDIRIPDDAQTGTQSGAGIHSGSFGISYSGLEYVSFSLTMATVRTLNKKDSSGVTNPFFDTDSDYHHRTRYAFGISGSI